MRFDFVGLFVPASRTDVPAEVLLFVYPFWCMNTERFYKLATSMTGVKRSTIFFFGREGRRRKSLRFTRLNFPGIFA